MKIIAKAFGLLVFVLLTLAVWCCTAILVLSAVVLGFLSRLLFPVSVLVMIFDSLKPGLALLTAAFLCSPYGLPLAATWGIGKISSLRSWVSELALG